MNHVSVLLTFASLRTTLVALLLLLAGVGGVLWTQLSPTIALAPAFMLLTANLATAIFVTDKIRRTRSLLVFHLVLLLLMILVAVSRTTYLLGWLELAEGEDYQALTGIRSQGPLHTGDAAGPDFQQGAIEIRFQNGMRGRTTSDLYFRGDGEIRKRTVVDQYGVNLDGYRLTLSNHYGYAPVFVWERSGQRIKGNVKMPSFPANRFNQANEWLLPGTDITLWTHLQINEELPVTETLFTLPETHKLVVRYGDSRIEIVPGDVVEIADGRLIYEGLSRWIGYEVFYDPTIPWMLATSLTAALSLLIYLLEKWRKTPW